MVGWSTDPLKTLREKNKGRNTSQIKSLCNLEKFKVVENFFFARIEKEKNTHTQRRDCDWDTVEQRLKKTC